MHLQRLFKELSGILLSGFALLCTLHSNGEALTLSDALDRARAANPELQALGHHAEGAAARIDAAGDLPDPKAQFTYFGESVETRTGPQEAIYSISQTIPWLSKLRTRTTLATRDAKAIAQLYQEGQLRIDEALTQAYTEAAYYGEAVRTTSENLQWIEDSRRIVEEQVRGGASLNALLRLEVELERMRDQLDRYTQEQFTHRTRLAALMGLDESGLDQLAEMPQPDNKSLDAPQLHTALLTNNPELLALQSRVQNADSQIKLSRLERYPDFTFGINYIQVGDDGANFSDAGRDPWNVTVAINLPIWEGKNRAAIQSAQSAERAVIETYRNRQLQLKADLSATLARRADSMRRIQRYQDKLIPLAEQALENSQAAYESGQISVLEMIDSERALLDLSLNYWRAVANALQAEARIERLVGASFMKTTEAQPNPPNQRGLHK